MAEGVHGAAGVICFMTQAYQDSANCKLELQYAQQSGVPIIPVMMQPNFVAHEWLGILTAGSIWTPMYDSASVVDGVTKLIAQTKQVIPELLSANKTNDTEQPSAISQAEDFSGMMRLQLYRLCRDRGISVSGIGNDPVAMYSACFQSTSSYARGCLVCIPQLLD
jgi:hypothetical protein